MNQPIQTAWEFLCNWDFARRSSHYLPRLVSEEGSKPTVPREKGRTAFAHQLPFTSLLL